MANRRYDRAIGLAQRFGGSAVAFDDLPRELEQADIVVSSTGAPHQIVGREELELRGRHADGPAAGADRPRGAARHRARACATCPGIALYDMDDLQRAVSAQPRRARGRGRARRRSLIDEEVARFEQLAGQPRRGAHDLRPAPSAATRSSSRCCARTRRAGSRLSEADRERLEVMARAVVSRLLHEPTLRLKGAAGDDGSYRLRARAARAVRPRGRARAARRGSPRREVTDLESRRRRRG